MTLRNPVYQRLGMQSSRACSVAVAVLAAILFLGTCGLYVAFFPAQRNCAPGPAHREQAADQCPVAWSAIPGAVGKVSAEHRDILWVRQFAIPPSERCC